MKLMVKSLRVENFIEGCYCENIDTEKNTRYILNCIDTATYHKYEILLWEEHGDCPSGYCEASWGIIKINETNKFSGFNHVLKPEYCDMKIEIPENISKYNEYKCDLFEYSYDNNDEWYPSGYCSLDMKYFEPTPRYKKVRPVWIFKGDSTLGKTYLSSLIINGDFGCITKYETDSNEKLPKELYQDIIVIGNKYNFSIDDIEKRILGEHESILVDFSKLN